MSDGKKDADDQDVNADAETNATEDTSPESTASEAPEAQDAAAGKQAEDTAGKIVEAVEEDPAEELVYAEDAQDDDHHFEDHHDDAREERQGWSMAAKALAALILLIAGGAIALIGGPKLAPMLPASVAAVLTPGASADVEALETRVAALEAAGGVEALESALSDAVEQSAATAAELSARIDVAEAALEALESVSSPAPVVIQQGDGDAEVLADAARLAALDSAISSLRTEIATLREQAAEGSGADTGMAAALQVEINALDERLSAAEEALSSGSNASKGAATAAAFAVLSTAVNSASPYEKELESFSSVSGVDAPEALNASAATGAPSMTSLSATFPAAASAAISAATRAAAGENYTDQALAWIESQVAVRPAGEAEGDAPPAMLSRAEARLEEGALAAALAEIEALPTVSKEAMASWIDRAQQRAAADAALADLAAAMLPGAQASN